MVYRSQVQCRPLAEGYLFCKSGGHKVFKTSPHPLRKYLKLLRAWVNTLRLKKVRRKHQRTLKLVGVSSGLSPVDL